MAEITEILSGLAGGNRVSAEELLPLVYDELRRLAVQRLDHEKPGQTLQATALVHEAYLRLLGSNDHTWGSRAHFFSAAAEAMRRILIDIATQATDPARWSGQADRCRRRQSRGPAAARGSPGTRRGPQKTRPNRPAQGPARQSSLLCRPHDSPGRGTPGHLARHRRTLLGLCPRLAAPGDYERLKKRIPDSLDSATFTENTSTIRKYASECVRTSLITYHSFTRWRCALVMRPEVAVSNEVPSQLHAVNRGYVRACEQKTPCLA